MPYEPRKPKNPIVKFLIPALIAVFVFAYIGATMLKPEEEIKMYTIGNLSGEKTKQLLEKKAKDTYTFSDYYFYGENLMFLKNDYNPAVNDDIASKSVILKDLCSDNEYAFVVGTTIDSGININNLEEGFYELYVVEDLIEKKAVFDENFSEVIKTSLKGNERNKVTIIASEEYFKEKNIKPKENYIYLQVNNTVLNEDEYDIAIDPAMLDYDFTWTVNEGASGNGLIEYQETLKAAQLLKKSLEEKGYKVLVVRKEDEEINSYGEDGRLKRAYDAKCKYYLRLSFSESDFNYEGFDIAYSAHSSKMFANQIIYYMERNSDMSISAVYSIGQDTGIYKCILLPGMDKRGVYDDDLWIREAGGKATNAGKYSENAKEGTAFFAENNVFGMQALHFNLGYLTNRNDVNYWHHHKEEYMQDLAEAISAYINTGA